MHLSWIVLIKLFNKVSVSHEISGNCYILKHAVIEYGSGMFPSCTVLKNFIKN